MKLRSIIDGDFTICKPAASVEEAAELMRETKSSSCLVGYLNRATAIFTTHDLLKCLSQPDFNLKTTKIDDVATSNLIKVSEDSITSEALDLMVEHGISHLPVTSEKDGDEILAVVHIQTLAKLAQEANVVLQNSNYKVLSQGLSHRIRNPLSAIMNNLSILRSLNKENGSANEASAIDAIEAQVNKTNKILNNLDIFNQNEEPEIKEVNIAGLVRSVLEVLQAKISKKRVSVRLLSSSEDLKLTCSPPQISHAVLQLVNNAIEAAPKGRGQITIEIKDLQGKMYITIGDNGEGVEFENRAKIFLPFFSTKNVRENTGLGLAIAQSVAQSHGGEISTEFTDKESKFIMTLVASNE